MNWKLLLLKKAVIGRLPYADGLRRFKRRFTGYPPDDGNVSSTLANYELLRQRLQGKGIELEDAVVLEIGSGWFPIIPILLVRDGARHVFASDLSRHMDEITFRETAEVLKRKLPDDLFIQQLSTLSALPITYLAPFDIDAVENESIDVIVSRTVLEHISRHDLYSLFSALRPKLKDGGSMAHVVDHSDHFEHHDKTLSRVNFLTWSTPRHALVNYLIKDGENRMRHPEYVTMFEDSGYRIIDEWMDVDAKTLRELDSLELRYPYVAMEPEQVAAVTSVYVLGCR